MMRWLALIFILLAATVVAANPQAAATLWLAEFNPALAVSDCVCWLDGQDAGTIYDESTLTWVDKSGANNNASRSGSGRPTAIPGGIEFDGADVLDFRGDSLSMFRDVPGITAFIIGTHDTLNEEQFIAATIDSTSTIRMNMMGGIVSGKLHGNARRLNTDAGASQNSGSYSAGEMYLQRHTISYLNGTQIISKNGQPTGTNSLASSGGNCSDTDSLRISLGAAYLGTSSILTQCLNGRIYEVVLFARALDSDECALIEGYLAHKWNLQLPNNHIWKDTPP